MSQCRCILSEGHTPVKTSSNLRLASIECGPVADLRRDALHLLGASQRVRLDLRATEVGNGRCPELSGLLRRAEAEAVLVLLPRFPREVPWLPELANQLSSVPSLVVTEASDADTLFELEELGFDNVVGSPLSAANFLPRLWRLAQVRGEAREISPAEMAAGEIPGLVGRSVVFRTQLAKIPVLARARAAVLIRGATGTGKELVARAIHTLSAGPRAPFVPINCGAIPAELIESELFGHGRSAFTGAQVERAGLIEEAAGGTLFLDEVDSLPLAAQVKLLRFLQDKEFRRLGSTQAKKSDARIIAATNTDVERAVETGRLRRDLYYRLNILPLTLPALAERREDIPLLTRHFLELHSQELGRRLPTLGIGVLETLLAHDWPGNVRELEHVLYRALVLTDGRPRLERRDIELPGDGRPENVASFREAKARVVRRFERSYLAELLAAAGGNISQAAQHAGKNRRAFFELIRKHGIDAAAYRGRA